jgi:hypothetical protein
VLEAALAALAATTSKELGTGELQRSGGDRGGGGAGVTGPARSSRSTAPAGRRPDLQALGLLATGGGGDLDGDFVLEAALAAAAAHRPGPRRRPRS